MKRAIIAGIVLMIVAAAFAADSRFFYQKDVTVNPYTPVTVTDGGVKSICVYSPNVNYKVSINTDSYTPMEKGGAFNFSNLNLERMTLRIQGNTETDTGIVHVIYTK